MKSEIIQLLAVAGSFIAILAIGGYFILKMKNSNDIELLKENGEVGNKPRVNTAQEFLPFKIIKDSMIDLGNNQYRMMIECGSINYGLRSEEEKDVIELLFKRCLSSMNFPYAFYVQTREIDNRVILEHLSKEMAISRKSYPQLGEYAQRFERDLRNLGNDTGISKHKKKYIIITYDDAAKLTHLSESEKHEKAFRELIIRCNGVINALKGVDIKSKILNNNEVAEVVFQAINKDASGVFDGISSGEFSESIVEGKEIIQGGKISAMAREDLILLETINKMKCEIVDGEYDADDTMSAQIAIEQLEKIRTSLGGYFKSSNSGRR